MPRSPSRPGASRVDPGRIWTYLAAGQTAAASAPALGIAPAIGKALPGTEDAPSA
jgi:hypothetical protein